MATSPGSNNVIVNVAEDSESNLEALFNVLTSADNKPSPGRKQESKSSFKGMPPSFHQIPDKSEKIVGPSVQVPQMGQQAKGPVHTRGMSLPVSLESYHRNSLEHPSVPLPPGWEMGKTPEGHSYFIKLVAAAASACMIIWLVKV